MAGHPGCIKDGRVQRAGAAVFYLLQSELQDAPVYRPSADLWAQAVRSSGYVQARVATVGTLSELSKAA